ncbi:uncharacterized protein [Drosophila takahashii]|uniref:uncharacterized protein n=1 Tax=Drosophila takahashii TaxID=29030 RepID=UPI003898FEAF
MSRANRASESTSALIQAIRESRSRNAGQPRLRSYDDELRDIADASHQNREQRDMDRFLNIKLGRDRLPEDTPLPIYLAHRERRSPSPESKWDKEKP